jgi:formate dehydrogenase subunit beta
MKNKIKEWLKSGQIDIFLGYKTLQGHPLPHAFGKDNLEDIDTLITGSNYYPLEKIATKLVAEKPDIKIGMITQDHSQRALNVLYIWNQLDPENIKPLKGDGCSSNLKEHADDSHREAGKSGQFKKQFGMNTHASIEEAEIFTQQERFQRWMYEFQKCIKCYGCRNICPVCFCKQCSLEHSNLIGTGSLPPEAPIYHLVRAVHMAGRCIDCGLCEEACPADIPLRLLYRKVNAIVTELFDYETGSRLDQSPFSIIGESITLKLKPIAAA